MTAQQLRRLAEHAAMAQDFYRRSNPSHARIFRDASQIANLLADSLQENENQAAIHAQLDEVKSALAPSISRG